MTTVDLAAIYREVTSPVLFICPHCGKPVRASMRLSYPPRAVGAFAEVYRCGGRNRSGCGRYIGAPIAREDNDPLTT
jgi:hypothetical protein